MGGTEVGPRLGHGSSDEHDRRRLCVAEHYRDSDGERIVLVAKPTEARPTEPLRYLTDLPAVFRAAEFEHAVSSFVEQVLGQLRAEKVLGTNLESAWADVCAERADTETTKRRRLEAVLGLDPDEANPSLLDRLVAEERGLGASAVREMAAMSSAAHAHVLTSASLHEIAERSGFEAQPKDVVRLKTSHGLPRVGDVPAWLRGAAAARKLRKQEKLSEAIAISNDRLAGMCGVTTAVLTEEKRAKELAFAIDRSPKRGQVVLRSKWETGRRFELARLLGDRIAGVPDGPLFPATRANTYRQKLQRSFAAELLSPFDAVDDMLDGDYSDERQEEVAEHFNVSPLTIRTLLMNHGRIERDEFEFAAAVA